MFQFHVARNNGGFVEGPPAIKRNRPIGGLSGAGKTQANRLDSENNRDEQYAKWGMLREGPKIDDADIDEEEICLECAIQAINVNTSNAETTMSYDEMQSLRRSQGYDLLHKLVQKEPPTTQDYINIDGYGLKWWNKTIRECVWLKSFDKQEELLHWMENDSREKAQSRGPCDVKETDDKIINVLKKMDE